MVVVGADHDVLVGEVGPFDHTHDVHPTGEGLEEGGVTGAGPGADGDRPEDVEHVGAGRRRSWGAVVAPASVVTGEEPHIEGNAGRRNGNDTQEEQNPVQRESRPCHRGTPSSGEVAAVKHRTPGLRSDGLGHSTGEDPPARHRHAEP